MNNVQVKLGQSIYDLMLATYGLLELTYKLIQENANITSLDFDFDANPNETIEYDNTFVVSVPAQLDRSSTVTEVTEASINTVDRQTLFDLCLMSYGNLENLYKLIADNSISTVDEVNLNGRVITFDKTLISDNIVYNWINKYGVVMCTGDGIYSNDSYNGSFNISFN